MADLKSGGGGLMSKKKGLTGSKTDEAQEVSDNRNLLANSGPRQARSSEEYVQAIRSAYQKGLEAILEVGRLLSEAKQQLPYGSWEAMVANDLPFDKRTAERLMALARHPVISNPAHAPLLPPHWMTLSDLARLDKKLGNGTLEAKLKDGTITPATQRKDVAALLQGADPPPKATRETKLQKASRTVQELRAHVDELEAARELPSEDVDDELTQLRAKVVELRRINLALEAENEELKTELTLLRGETPSEGNEHSQSIAATAV
jgi:hypothetical protein